MAWKCFRSIAMRAEGFEYILNWWLKKLKTSGLSLHQALFRLDILNLLVSKIAVKERTPT
jgi:hypothetical protein